MKDEFSPNDHFWLDLARRWRTEAVEISQEMALLQEELEAVLDLIKRALDQVGKPPE